MKTGIQIIEEERKRQISAEKFDVEHDIEEDAGELAFAASAYAQHAAFQSLIEGSEYSNVTHEYIPEPWPWDESWWKPSNDKIRNLAKAGALIAAEIDRLQRLNKNEF